MWANFPFLSPAAESHPLSNHLLSQNAKFSKYVLEPRKWLDLQERERCVLESI